MKEKYPSSQKGLSDGERRKKRGKIKEIEIGVDFKLNLNADQKKRTIKRKLRATRGGMRHIRQGMKNS